MSSIKFGEPFAYPVTQTILPVLLPSGQVMGFIPIAKTTFSQAASQVELPEGEVTAVSVTLPPSPGNYRVGQYAAVVYSWADAPHEPWTGFSGLITTNETGYFNQHVMAAGGMLTHFSWGTVLNCLQTNMDDTFGASAAAEAEQKAGGSSSDAQPIVWSATVNMDTMSKLTFFDFGWYNLVLAKKQIAGIENWAKPVIQTIASPMPAFKATVVRSADGTPGCEFDAIRIIKLALPARRQYTFTFKIFDAANPAVSYSSTFNLTVA